MSLKKTITEYLKAEYPRIVHKGEIGRKSILEWGYENENSGRRCRELENEGIIEKIENSKGEAQYRYKQNPTPQTRVITPFLQKWQEEFSKPVVNEIKQKEMF